MSYNELIKINEDFQYSVNLQFDLNNIDKIKNYIPTKDGCDVLKQFINSIINKKNRATTLVGPYGKGKSHLLLVLLTIMSDYETSDEKIIKDFLKKVKNVDAELYDSLSDIRKNKTRLMPVIINSNYNDLNQAFLLAINESLNREKIDGLVVNTYYDVALEIIKNWQENYKEISKDIKKCLEDHNMSIKELKNGLKNYSKEHYEIFKDLYRCISRGQEFNPLVNSDILKIYKDINHEILQYGYTGMFIAFDEFSKFIDSSNDNLMKDLKILQDFAEYANRTGSSEQMHLSCITHKTMNEYFKEDEFKMNAYKTVEGRFRNIYFNRSLEQNYEIVSYAIEKKEKFNSFFNDYYNNNKDFYDKINGLPLFNNNDDRMNEQLFKGCFPLNPITVYDLIQLSEKIAQNERTLFTFLSDDDQYSLKSFINKNVKGLFNVDNIYDYFRTTLKKSEDQYIKEIYLKTESSLRKNISDDAKKILKVLSVIYMIKEFDLLYPSDEIVMLSTDMSKKKYELALEELINKSIIRRKKITDELDFASIYSTEITKEIKNLVDTKFFEINEKEVINKIVDNWYSLPRRYNDKYKMTRFFLNIFMSEEELLNINNFSTLLEENYCDGLIINLIKMNKDINDIVNKFMTINDDRVILKISKSTFSKKFSNLLKEYEAIEYLKERVELNDDSINEIITIETEISDAVSEAIKDFFSEDSVNQYVYCSEIKKNVNHVSALLSDVCEKIYCETPVVNNEMINKKEVSAPIRKARDIVIECVLQHDINLIKSPTSAEATIYKAIVEKRNTDSVEIVLNIIKEFVKSTDNNRKNFNEIYELLLNKPYGIRKGIIPVLMAMSLSDYSNNLVLYYMNREVDLNADTLVKINDNPEKYFLQTEEGTTEKIEYITYLMSIYGVAKTSDSLMLNVRKTVEAMKKWILSMPRLIRESNQNNNLGVDNKYILIKSELLRPDLNNNEFIFNFIKESLDINDYNKIVSEINKMKNIFDSLMKNYEYELVSETRKIFNKNFKGSLTSLLKDWYKNINPKNKKKIYDVTTKSFMEYISELNNHDEYEVINSIAKIVTGFYIEDWQPTEKENYLETLNQIVIKLNSDNSDDIFTKKIVLVDGKKSIEKNIESDDELSALGITMKNNIEEVIEEYGDSLSEQDKINVLINIMKKYM